MQGDTNPNPLNRVETPPPHPSIQQLGCPFSQNQAHSCRNVNIRSAKLLTTSRHTPCSEPKVDKSIHAGF